MFAEETRPRKPGFLLAGLVESPPYPFQRISSLVDGSDTGVVALIAPFFDLKYYKVSVCAKAHFLLWCLFIKVTDCQAEMARALFWRLKANGHIVIGISSYQDFPGNITNPFDDRHVTPADMEILRAVDGWLHCFR